MNSLSNAKQARLDTAPIRLGVGLVPETQSLLGRVDGGTDVFAHPALAHRPSLVEQGDRPLRIDFAHDMNAPGHQGQSSIWNQFRQRAGQRLKATTHLRWGFAIQFWGLILRPIPTHEQRRFALHLGAVGELLTRPEAGHPEAVKRLDLVIALGLVEGSEQRFDLTIQTQAHHRAEHPCMGLPTAKGAFVVELVQKRSAKFGPGFQQVRLGRGRGLVGVLCQANCVRVEVDGMKVLDRLAPTQVFGNDIGGKDGIDVPRLWPWLVGRFVIGANRMS